MSPARKLAQRMQPSADGPQIEYMTLSINYLYLFGYLAIQLLDRVSLDDVRKAVAKFQQWWGIKKEDGLGPKTVRAMMCPRCGCPDFVNPDHAGHVRYLKMMEYVTNGTSDRWRKKGLSYYVKGYLPGLARSEQLAVYAAAWKAWDSVCGIEIRRATRAAKADVVIDIGEGQTSHFDGPGGALAWSELPDGSDAQLQMRFDAAETWVTNPRQRGVLLRNVACHEFGHLLGLTHSPKPGALMAPHYNPAVGAPQWDDDIPQVQARYGPQLAALSLPEETYTLCCSHLVVDGYQLVPG